jgi:two-component system osmolarity sensor histidine kinase EnvZ
MGMRRFFQHWHWLPQSLFGRFLLIIVVPNLVVQAVAVYMFYERHWQSVSRHMAMSLAGDVEMVVESLQRAEPEEHQELLYLASRTLHFTISLTKTNETIVEQHSTGYEFRNIIKELSLRLPHPFSVRYNSSLSDVLIDVSLPFGVLEITASRKRLANPSTYIFIMWMTGTGVIFVLISILFMRNQVRSMTRLAEAAEHFGKGLELESGSFKPGGAKEVRQAGQAFLDMQERIARQVEQRTEMLAGVSHDLKTPLTRIKLQMAMLEQTKEMKELQEDIVEMEKMVHGYLDFAKGKERQVASPVNISDLLRSITSGYRHDHGNIELKVQAGITLSLNSNYFRRAITNIIDNALKYGENVKVNATTSNKKFILIIDDDGPGIPPKKRDVVFKAFHRLDRARNLNEGGTGLGLTVAKDIITGYGGDISLDNSPTGGLRVVIRLPL